jgi:hypothetical protein
VAVFLYRADRIGKSIEGNLGDCDGYGPQSVKAEKSK